MANIPAFTNTPIEKISQVHEKVTKSFLAHKTRPVEFRLQQLRKLYWGYVFQIKSVLSPSLTIFVSQNQGQHFGYRGSLQAGSWKAKL